MKIIITENERKPISSQHEEFESYILNFLMRRINVEKRKLGGDFGDFEPLTTIEYNFNGFPGHGFNSFQNRSYWERRVIELLEEAEIIPQDWAGDLKVENPERQKIIRTIRKFIKNILIN
jgi:hypothetical protein